MRFTVFWFLWIYWGYLEHRITGGLRKDRMDKGLAASSVFRSGSIRIMFRKVNLFIFEAIILCCRYQCLHVVQPCSLELLLKNVRYEKMDGPRSEKAIPCRSSEKRGLKYWGSVPNPLGLHVRSAGLDKMTAIIWWWNLQSFNEISSERRQVSCKWLVSMDCNANSGCLLK